MSKKTKRFFRILKDKLINFENSISDLFGRRYYKKLRSGFEGKKISIIANNCVGGVIYHQIGCSFESPTINLKFDDNDFIKFLKNFDSYLEAELEEIETKQAYPVGVLKLSSGEFITIYFVHYKSFKEAKQKWDSRKKRIDKSNMYVIFDTCGTKNVERMKALVKSFNELDYKNKLFLTTLDLDGENVGRVNMPDLKTNGNWITKRNKSLYRRYCDLLDYRKIFNIK